MSKMREALREMVYETTSLSPMEPDGSHWCRITAATLANARAALSAPDESAELREALDALQAICGMTHENSGDALRRGRNLLAKHGIGVASETQARALTKSGGE